MEAAGDKLLQELRETMAAAEKLIATAGSEGADRLKEVEEQVRKHPFAALGIAAAVGLVIGLLAARK